jgi:oligopeptide transport system substrate-binding protein
MRQMHADEMVTGPFLSTVYITFNTKEPPFDDQRVRQAFVMAVDRVAFLDQSYSGIGKPGNGGLIPPGMPGNDPQVGLPHDPIKARELLTQAGYPDGKGFPPIIGGTLFVADHKAMNNLYEQWRESLNIEVVWENIDYEAFLSEDWQDDSRAQLIFMGWRVGIPDPVDLLEGAVRGIKAISHWNNDLYDDLVNTARTSLDNQERLNLYKQAQRILIQEAPIMPLIYGSGQFLIKPWVRRYPFSAFTNWVFKDIVIEPH